MLQNKCILFIKVNIVCYHLSLFPPLITLLRLTTESATIYYCMWFDWIKLSSDRFRGGVQAQLWCKVYSYFTSAGFSLMLKPFPQSKINRSVKRERKLYSALDVLEGLYGDVALFTDGLIWAIGMFTWCHVVDSGTCTVESDRWEIGERWLMRTVGCRVWKKCE